MFGVTGFKTDREDDIIVEHTDGYRFRLMALGSEQKVRGLLWEGKRPDLVVGDDLENDEIVMNPDRREKFRNWIFNALIPAMSERGIIRLVGTILHMDSLLERLMPRERDFNTLTDPLRMWMKVPKNGWMSAKYQAHDEAEPMKSKYVLWPEKWSRQRLHDVRQTFLGQGNPEGYYQEYLNKAIDPSNAYFKKDDFEEMTPDEHQLEGKQFVNYICMDLATTTRERRDYCVFIVGGMAVNGMLYIRHMLKQRMDSAEIIETIFNLFKKYPADQVVMETGTIEKALGPFLKAEMMRRGVFLPLLTFPTNQDKPQRARSIQARLRAGGVKFDKRKQLYPDLENEMLRFPKDAHDDVVDAMALLGMTLDKMIEAPTNKEIEEEDWMESQLKFNSVADTFQGRSAMTGY